MRRRPITAPIALPSTAPVRAVLLLAIFLAILFAILFILFVLEAMVLLPSVLSARGPGSSSLRLAVVHAANEHRGGEGLCPSGLMSGYVDSLWQPRRHAIVRHRPPSCSWCAGQPAVR